MRGNCLVATRTLRRRVLVALVLLSCVLHTPAFATPSLLVVVSSESPTREYIARARAEALARPSGQDFAAGWSTLAPHFPQLTIANHVHLPDALSGRLTAQRALHLNGAFAASDQELDKALELADRSPELLADAELFEGLIAATSLSFDGLRVRRLATQAEALLARVATRWPFAVLKPNAYPAAFHAWLVFQAHRQLGTAGEHAGVAVREDAKGAGAALTVAPTQDAKGVLQVQVKKNAMATILSAQLPGLGSIDARDMQVKPLGELRIPIRFEVESLLGKDVGIFVNENGRAWYAGPGLEQALYAYGGGTQKLGPRDPVHPNERHFVDEGLRRIVARLLPQRLGDKLEL